MPPVSVNALWLAMSYSAVASTTFAESVPPAVPLPEMLKSAVDWGEAEFWM